MRAGFGIGQCVVVMPQIVSAGRGYGVQLVVGKLPPEKPARRPAGAEKLIARPRQVVEVQRRPQAPLVERGVVRHQRQPLDAGRQGAPYLLEFGRLVGVGTAQTVNRRGERAVIVGARADQAVKRIDHLAAAHHDRPHRTDARPVAVGRLEVDGSEIGHHSHSMVAGGLDEMS